MANEYRANHADLLAVANAIRAKSGKTDALTFPSEFVSAIANISSMPTGLRKVAIGSYTATDNVYEEVAIEHGLGEAPNFIAIAVDTSNFTDFDYKDFYGMITAATCTVPFKYWYNSSYQPVEMYYLPLWGVQYQHGSQDAHANKVYGTSEPTATTFYIPGDDDIWLSPGNTYHWICGVFDKFGG
jgi:hypothetical protein